MKLFLRHAELNDVEFINKLSNQLGYKSTIEKTHNRLSEILNNVDNCIYVIIVNENIIGWIHGFYSLRVESESFVEIGGLIVDENYRRNGIGKILVKKVIEWAHSKKSNKIRVRCNTLRKETHIFYNRIGFIETKEQKIFDMNLG
ncbi:GNAT family N-acetyltransferase [Flavobacterium pectinovorum]|jgi:GNAT superfamily N-acetyltransferase|uniref:GNAT family N-acetyltransferase n=1 Tax=Flavobacterium pectinovorum TaxID=29533 RepID=A0A502EM91_9FLAO|nr:GNAT family N-acetyltransferase [Flavobacterium pectinovorum]TPG38179.1 GNAT family N-acetyltransferase [Flavobacterium pectinovorum]